MKWAHEFMERARTARRPPNAPDTVAAEKKMAERRPNSERLYQLYRIVRRAAREVREWRRTHHDR